MKEKKTVWVETVLWENPRLAAQRRVGGFNHLTEEISPPEGHRTGGVSPAEYDAYGQGLERACADIVICTRLENGQPAVLAIRRAAGKPFGGCWWPQGGAIHAYRSVLDFVVERAEQECGVQPVVQGLVGFYRTCASDGVASTIQACYVASVRLKTIEQAKADQNHSNWRLLTLADLEGLPEAERHWYPMRVFRLALETMP